MAKKKNPYVSALLYEINTESGTAKMLNVLRIKPLLFTTSHCWNWIEHGRTEKEIINMLRKLGYDIPKEIVGSDTVFDGSE